MTSRLRCQFGFWVCLLGLQASAVAQAPYKHLQGCSDAAHAAVVEGQVVSSVTGKGSPRHAVILEGADYCHAMTDSLGGFQFKSVPAGEYRLLVTDLTYARFRPIEFTVSAGETVRLKPEVEPYDIVGDCLDAPACSRVLEPRPEREVAPHLDPLIEAGYRTALAVVWAKPAVPRGWIPCIRDSRPALMAQIRLRVSNAVSSEECEMKTAPDGVPDKRVFHRASDRSAFFLEFRLLDRTETRAEGYITLSVAPLWGAEWQCYYERRTESWVLTNCVLIAVA